jgi:3-oxoacyl-[acyl-carrier protein] reductase
MDFGLKDRVAAVAASSQGLGFAAAHALAAEGAKIGICSRSADNIEKAATRLRDDTGADVFTRVVDLSDRRQATGFVDAVAKHFGALDVLVTNAGGPPPGGFAQAGFDELERAFHLTMESTIAMIQAAVPRMQSRNWGRIINILSITVKQPETNLLMSNTMRAGLVGYTKSVSLELAKDNVLINNVAPGYTRTERLNELAENLAGKEKMSVDEVYARWESKIPMARLGRPEELGAVIAFLASERASYVTGTTLQVDGGFVQGLL